MWCGSQVFAAEVCWIAYSGDKKGVLSSVVRGRMPESSRKDRSLGRAGLFPEVGEEWKDLKVEKVAGLDVRVRVYLSRTRLLALHC
jgi:hypothetical protein